jgi:hypothetical protein
MEPAERFLRRLAIFIVIIIAFIVSIVLGEFYRGAFGLLIFILGASSGAFAIYLWKLLRKSD